MGRPRKIKLGIDSTNTGANTITKNGNGSVEIQTGYTESLGRDSNDSESNKGIEGGIGSVETVDAESAELPSTGDGPKRRGRPKGSKNSSKKTPNLDGLESILLSTHAMLSVLLSCPELELDEKESEKLTQNISNVASHYPLEIPAKTVAWAGLIMCCGSIYGTRAIAIHNRLKEKRKNNPQLVRPISVVTKLKPNGAPIIDTTKQEPTTKVDNRSPSFFNPNPPQE